jgi:hypothetical protein
MEVHLTFLEVEALASPPLEELRLEFMLFLNPLCVLSVLQYFSPVLSLCCSSLPIFQIQSVLHYPDSSHLEAKGERLYSSAILFFLLQQYFEIIIHSFTLE